MEIGFDRVVLVIALCPQTLWSSEDRIWFSGVLAADGHIIPTVQSHANSMEIFMMVEDGVLCSLGLFWTFRANFSLILFLQLEAKSKPKGLDDIILA
jgi:hypothetical protein